MRDIENFFNKLVPEDERLYEHDCEGPDDMPAHIEVSLRVLHYLFQLKTQNWFWALGRLYICMNIETKAIIAKFTNKLLVNNPLY